MENLRGTCPSKKNQNSLETASYAGWNEFSGIMAISVSPGPPLWDGLLRKARYITSYCSILSKMSFGTLANFRV